MAAKAGHRLHRGQRALQPVQRCGLGAPAHVARHGDRQQIEPDVGGRGAVCDHRHRRFLKVVRRQVVVALGDEGFKIAPGAAGDQAQRGAFGGGQGGDGMGRGGLADAVRNQRRGEPERQQRQRNRPDGGIGDHHPTAQDQGRRKPARPPPDAGHHPRCAATRLRGGDPFQQMPARHPHPQQCPQHGIGHLPRGSGKEREAKPDPGQRGHRIGAEGCKMAAQGDAFAQRQRGKWQRQQKWQGEKRQQRQREGQRLRRRQQPAGRQSGDGHRRGHRPAQVVEHLGPPQSRNVMAPPPENPRQQLPVAPCPTVLAACIHIMAGRKILDHLDVGCQSGPGKDALEQIMAQHGVFGHATVQGGRKRIDVINALSGERPLAPHVLIDVRHRCRIGLDPAGAGKDAGVERALRRHRQPGRDTRLQDAIAGGDPLQDGVEMRAVQRMRHLADHPGNGVAQQPGVGIQRDDMRDVLRRNRA